MVLAVKNRDLTKVMIDFSPRNSVGYICVFLYGICSLFHTEKHPAGKAEGHSLWKSQNYRGIPLLSPLGTCERMVWLFSNGVVLSANASEGPAVRIDETTRALTASTLQVNPTDAPLCRSVENLIGTCEKQQKWAIVYALNQEVSNSKGATVQKSREKL